MATTLRTLAERFEANALALRALVDAGSPRVVRDAMEGGAISGRRRKSPLPGIGFRCGQLTVTGYIRGIRGGVGAVIVQCGCGRPEYTVDTSSIKSFCSRRCAPCGNEAAAKKRYWQYNDVLPDTAHRTRLLNRLSAAITRCHNPNDAGYASYGGRGISVCQQWRVDRAAFLQYVQTCAGWDDPKLDMDREETDGNYEPGNIRFITRAENARNKRRVNTMSAEIASLRLALVRAKESVHGHEWCWAGYCT